MKKAIFLGIFLVSLASPTFASTLSSAYIAGSVSQDNFIAHDTSGQIIDYSSLPITNDGYANAVNQYNTYCTAVQSSKNVELDFSSHHPEASVASINQKYAARFPDCDQAFKVLNSLVLDAVARLKSGSTVSQIQCDYSLIFDMKYQNCQSRDIAEKDNMPSAPIAATNVMATTTAFVTPAAALTDDQKMMVILDQIIKLLQAQIAAILVARGQ